MQVSNATNLPVAEAASAYVAVTLLGGQQVALRPSDVVEFTTGQYWGPTRNRLVKQAET
jgi:hypothetical protein